MDKQQADHIDHKIRQAAAHSDPPFKEEAWQRMESKLDEDLNKRNRRGFIWWWMLGALMLAGGLGFYMYQQSNEDRKQVTVTSEKTITSEKKVASEKKLQRSENTGGRPRVENQTGGKVSLKHLRVSGWDDKNKTGVHPGINKKHYLLREQKYLPEETGLETVKRSEDDLMDEPVEQGETGAKNPVQANKNVPADSIRPGRQTDPLPMTAPAKDSLKTVSSEKKKREKLSGFYFIPSAAMDATSLKRVRINQKMRPVFGIAAGYRINDRLSLQTGFYAGKKIYQAGPGDYKVKPGSYLSMVDMIRIGADCYIYEIPLSVRYDILAGKRSRVYAISGLTSVIMKRETYDYHYRRSSVYGMMETTYNGNKHLFSLLNVSAGYERKISRTLHIQAEPYINLPLSGIGEGKVKLYSAGLRAGIKYTPVKKNKIITR
jgi:hypothetical protein